MIGHPAYASQPLGDTQPAGPHGPALSGWWRRVGATTIDGILAGIASVWLTNLYGHGLIRIVTFLILPVYTVALLGSLGQTVGNLTVRTKVVAEDSLGPIGYGTAFLRWLVSSVLVLTVVGEILDSLWPLWDERNQTLHDKAASTLVIKV